MQHPLFAMSEEQEDMYPEVDWLAPADRYILEYLNSARKPDGEPAEQTPKVIGLNTTISRKHSGARCRVLDEKGLVEKTDRGVYRITELGERFVKGELEPDDLRDL